VVIDAVRFMPLRRDSTGNCSQAAAADAVQLFDLPSLWGLMGLLHAKIGPRRLRGRRRRGVYLGHRAIEFYHCTYCGCLTHYERAEKRHDDTRIAVNARMLEPEDIVSIRIRKLDGAATWNYLDE